MKPSFYCETAGTQLSLSRCRDVTATKGVTCLDSVTCKRCSGSDPEDSSLTGNQIQNGESD